MFLLGQLTLMCLHSCSSSIVAPCHCQNTWPICALVVCSAAVVVAVAATVDAVAAAVDAVAAEVDSVAAEVDAVAAEVEFVKGGCLAMIQSAVVAGYLSITVWSLVSLLAAIVVTVS